MNCITQSLPIEFEATVLPHLNDLYRIAVRVIGNRTDAEDIVQETCLQAMRSFHRFEAGTNIRAWLFKIMFHVVSHHRRKVFRFKQADVDDEQLAETLACEPSIEPDLRDEEMIASLNRVPLKYRAIILLADVQEYSYREIADILRIPIGTVMSRLSRGRSLLRAALLQTRRPAALTAKRMPGRLVPAL